jgi:hypothetical protein
MRPAISVLPVIRVSVRVVITGSLIVLQREIERS